MKDVSANALDRAMSLDAARFAMPVYKIAKLAFGDQCEKVDVLQCELLDNKDGTYSYTARFRPHPPKACEA